MAMASATLSCVIGSVSSSTCTSMRCTARLSAPPLPVTDCFTSCGVYSAMTRPARAPHTSATPRASATDIAVLTFLLKYSRSRARYAGECVAMSSSIASAIATSFSAALPSRGVATRPWSRSWGGSVLSSRSAYPIPVVPGSIPRTVVGLGVLKDLVGSIEVRVDLLHVIEVLEILHEAEDLSGLVTVHAHRRRWAHRDLGRGDGDPGRLQPLLHLLERARRRVRGDQAAVGLDVLRSRIDRSQ